MRLSKIKQFYRFIEKHDWVENARWLERHREKEIIKLLYYIDKNYFLPKNKKILDAGCGTGLISRHLQKHSIGIDINPWAIKKARVHAPNIRYVIGDLERLPFKPQTFNIIICSEVIEHLANPKKAIEEFCKSLCHNDGILIGSVPHKNILWSPRVRQIFTPLKFLEPIHNTYEPDDIFQLLKTFPFKNIYVDFMKIENFFLATKKIRTKVKVWDVFWKKQNIFNKPVRNIFNYIFVKTCLLHALGPLVLDVGIGSGSCANIVSKHKSKVVGVDISPVAIKKCKKSGIKNILLAEAHHLPFKNKSFHLAYAQGLIEHIETPEIALREMKRVSKKVIVSIPRYGGILEIVHRFFYWLNLPWLWPEENYYTPITLKLLLSKVFSSYKIKTFFGMDLIGYGK